MSRCDWFESSLGQFLLEQERLHCRKLLPYGYYPLSLQVGQPSLDFLEQLETERRFFISEDIMDNAAELPSATLQPKPEQNAEGYVHCVVANTAAMPFANKTHNLIILPHTLDFSAHPHAVLREVNHILVPQGCVIITGFNRLSIWGLLNAMRRQSLSGYCHRVGQVQDWLALLGFDLVGASMLAYQIPLQSAKWRKRLAFIEKAGARWWPALGAVYVIVGRKEEIAISGRRPARMKWQRWMKPTLARSVSSLPIEGNKMTPPHAD